MKVSKDHIDNLLSQVEYKFIKVSQSHIMCLAFLDGFKVGQGESKTIDPKEYKEDLGKEYSLNQAMSEAEEKLWELEGYVLHKSLSQNKVDSNVKGFNVYDSKPVQRLAKQITNSKRLVKLSDTIFEYFDSDMDKPIQFAAHEYPVEGGYIVFLNNEDVYYCNEQVFKDRNIV